MRRMEVPLGRFLCLPRYPPIRFSILQRAAAKADERPVPLRADIQGLRAVAVLLVVAFHAGLPLPGGFSGVDVFFAASGFVITTTLVRELASTGRVRPLRFYGRRIRRLLPALAVMLTVVAVLGTLASPFAAQRTGALTGIAASFFGANLYLAQLPTGYFDVSSSLDPLLHTWTLAVEEQFYLVFPLLLVFAWRLGRGGAAALVGLLSVGSFGLAVSLAGSSFGFYSAATRAWELGAGALVALAAPALAHVPARLASLLGVLGLAAIGFTALGVRGTSGDPRDVLLAVGGTCAVLVAARGPAARVLATPPAVWVGNLSYSLYLWHWPLIVFAGALWPGARGAVLVAAAVSLLPAWLSYRHVENPIRRGARFRGRAVVALAGACVAVPVAASLALVAVNHLLVRSPAIASWEATRLVHTDQLRGCVDPGRCVWHVPRARGRVALVGDSQAGQFSEPVILAAERVGYDAHVVTMNACPFGSVAVTRDPAARPACSRFNTAALAALTRLRPDVVVLASRSDFYVGEAGSRARLWERGLATVIERLNAVGTHVLVVHPIPRLEAAPQGCAVLAILVKSCSGAVDRRAADRERRLAVGAEKQAVVGAVSASAVDFDDLLCGPSRCTGAHAGRWTYRDNNHLTVSGALLLTDRFTQLFAARRTSS
jgi:peptidoglycan/LPS O-acetylase OafA/YrhL